MLAEEAAVRTKWRRKGRLLPRVGHVPLKRPAHSLTLTLGPTLTSTHSHSHSPPPDPPPPTLIFIPTLILTLTLPPRSHSPDF